MNKKERKANQVLAVAQEVVKERTSRKVPAVLPPTKPFISNPRYAALLQMKAGILLRSTPTDILSSFQGIIPKGQCVLFDHVSPNSVRVITNDGRTGTCWNEEVSQMRF